MSSESIFGIPLGGGHARPIALRAVLPNRELLARWCRHADDVEILGFYRLLAAGDREKIQDRVAQILDEARTLDDRIGVDKPFLFK